MAKDSQEVGQELCGDVYNVKVPGEEDFHSYCEKKKGHLGWHKVGGFQWKRKSDDARDGRIRRARTEAIEFVRDLAKDTRSFPWCITAREIVTKLDQ